MKNTFAKITYTLACFVFAVLLICSALALYVYTGPRKISVFSNYVAAYISNQFPQLNVEISDTTLAWDKKVGNSISIKFDQVNFYIANKGELKIRAIKFSFNLAQFFFRDNCTNFINSIEIDPEITFIARDKSDIESHSHSHYDFHSHDGNISTFASSTFHKMAGTLQDLADALQNISINLLLIENKPPTPILIKKITFEPIQYQNMTSLQTYIELGFEEDLVNISAYVDTSSANTLKIRGEIKDFMPSIFSNLSSNQNIFDALAALTYKFDIGFSFSINNDYQLENMRLNILNYPKSLNKSILFEENIEIQDFQLIISCDDNCTQIRVDDFKIISSDLNLTGTFSKDNAQPINGVIAINPIEVEKIYKYWPNILVSDVKKWLKDNLTSGLAKDIKIDFSFDIPSLSKGDIARETVLASFSVEDGSLSYMENIPKLDVKNAKVLISAHEAEIKSQDTKLLNNKINDITVKINYFTPQQFNLLESTAFTSETKVTTSKDALTKSDTTSTTTNPAFGSINDFITEQQPPEDVYLNIVGSISGTLQDLIDLGFLHANKDNNSLIGYKGDATANLKLSIPLKEKITQSDINLSINAVASSVSIPPIASKYPVKAKKASISLNDWLLTVQSESLIIGGVLPSSVKVEYNISSNSNILITGLLNADAAQFRGANINIPNFINGKLKSNFSASLSDAYAKYDVSTDLQNAKIALSSIGLEKPEGMPAKLNFSISDKQENLSQLGYEFYMPNFESKGGGTISKNLDMISIKSDSSLFYNRPFALVYTSKSNLSELFLSSDIIDLSSIKFLELNDLGKSKSKKNFSLTTKFNKILLQGGLSLKDSNISVKCDEVRCKEAEVSGNFDEKSYFTMFYHYPVVAIISNDAGKISKALGLYNNLEGGTLELKAKLRENSDFTGDLFLNHFHIRNAPILAKLLSVSALTSASFKGLADVVSGKGVGFDTLACGLEYDFPAFYLKECRAKGPILGIKGSGVVNYKTRTIKAAGVVVPKNIVNTIMQAIPLVGRIISGGKDNGLISTNFYVSGSLDGNINLSINPLSLLTPGFFGEIFNQERSIIKKIPEAKQN